MYCATHCTFVSTNQSPFPHVYVHWSHCLAAWPDTKCLEQTLSFSSLSSVRSSRLTAEVHARPLLVVNSFITSPSFLTIFGTRLLKFHYRILFCELFPLLLPQPTIMHRTMIITNHKILIFHSLNR